MLRGGLLVGFIRRVLAGELLGLFGPEHYFAGLRVLKWLQTVVFVAGLAAVAWTVRPRRSERHLLLALLIPVLPFGFAFGVFSARTDLLGATALAVFACVLTRLSSSRSVLIVSALYGAITAVLTLIHEATPFLFGLGPSRHSPCSHEKSPRALSSSAACWPSGRHC